MSFNKIKKKYSESMAKLCRELFPELIDSDILYQAISSSFQEQKSLYADLVRQNKTIEFKSFIYSKIDVEKSAPTSKTTLSSYELMSKAGYELFECKTESEIQSFKKYYAPKESLCTFKNDRLKTCHVFFAVKKDVENIKRFEKPARQDAYGASVISIQFSKGKTNHLSIKNRYNHSVNNCDATFNNNLDNIIEGLTEAFKKDFGFNFSNNKMSFELKNYISVNGKFYKYNHEINNIYYCSKNIIIDNFEVKSYDKNEFLVLDYFIFDFKNKIVSKYDKKIKDAFCNNCINFKLENNTITSDLFSFTFENNKIKTLTFAENVTIGDSFLFNNEDLEILAFEKNVTIGDRFLYCNEALTDLTFAENVTIGDSFLYCNNSLTSLTFAKNVTVRDNFLYCNNSLTSLTFAKNVTVGDNFLYYNKALTSITFAENVTIGSGFLYHNHTLTR